MNKLAMVSCFGISVFKNMFLKALEKRSAHDIVKSLLVPWQKLLPPKFPWSKVKRTEQKIAEVGISVGYILVFM